MDLIDTHLHLWDLGRFSYSWCAGIPALNRNFLWGDYAAASAGLGIAKAVFVECDVDEPHALDEALVLQALSQAHPQIAGIVASGRPEAKEFPAHLERLRQIPKVRGLRRVLHTQPDGVSGQCRFVENIRRLAAAGLTFDLCVLARQLPVGLELVQRCPEVTFILDHCGIPDVAGGALQPWLSDLAELAALPNVHCKISGLVAYAGQGGAGAAELRPWFDAVLDQFGWDRVIWGGDWPVCTVASSLARWVEATRELTGGATDDERARLFHRNAERLYHV
jgi:predicted TIM-barrel fold metal-dependent hydrolase